MSWEPSLAGRRGCVIPLPAHTSPPGVCVEHNPGVGQSPCAAGESRAWTHNVTAWSPRKGVAASRLRLELMGGERRKVLWSHFRSADAFAEIEPALTRSLHADRRHDRPRS